MTWWNGHDLQYDVNRRADVISLGAGVFEMDPVRMRDGVRVQGAGMHATTVRPRLEGWKGSYDVAMFDFSSASYAALSDLTIDIQGESRRVEDAPVVPVIISNGEHNTIERVRFANPGNIGAVSPGGPMVVILARGVNGGQTQGDIGDTRFNTVRDCLFSSWESGTFEFAIRVKTDWETDDGAVCEHNVIEGNVFVDPTPWNTIELAGPRTRHNIVQGNRLSGVECLSGIDLDKGASYNLVDGNMLAGLSLPNKYVDSEVFNALADHGGLLTNYGNRIVNNVVTGSVASGGLGNNSLLYLERTERGLYQGNLLEGLAGEATNRIGVFSYSDTVDGFVLDNHISDVKSGVVWNVAQRGSTARCRIDGNKVSSEGTGVLIGATALDPGAGVGFSVSRNTVSSTVTVTDDYPDPLVVDNFTGLA